MTEMTAPNTDRAKYAPLLELLGWKLTSTAEWPYPRVPGGDAGFKLWVRGENSTMNEPDVLSPDVMAELMNWCDQHHWFIRLCNFCVRWDFYMDQGVKADPNACSRTSVSVSADTPMEAVADGILEALERGYLSDKDENDPL